MQPRTVHAFQVADRVLLLERRQSLAQGDHLANLSSENLSRLCRVTVPVTEVVTPAGRRSVLRPGDRMSQGAIQR